MRKTRANVIWYGTCNYIILHAYILASSPTYIMYLKHICMCYVCYVYNSNNLPPQQSFLFHLETIYSRHFCHLFYLSQSKFPILTLLLPISFYFVSWINIHLKMSWTWLASLYPSNTVNFKFQLVKPNNLDW